MPKQKSIPMRQCVVCRELKEKRAMLRIVKTAEGKVFLDFSGKASGRGAYICDNPKCIANLKAKKTLDKVFACRVDEKVYASIEEEYLGGKG